jgi:hypothetical protein
MKTVRVIGLVCLATLGFFSGVYSQTMRCEKSNDGKLKCKPVSFEEFNEEAKKRLEAMRRNEKILKRIFEENGLSSDFIDFQTLSSPCMLSELENKFALAFSLYPSYMHPFPTLKGAIIASEVILPGKLKLQADTAILAKNIFFEGDEIEIKGNHAIFLIATRGIFARGKTIKIDTSGKGRKEWLESFVGGTDNVDRSGVPGADGRPGRNGASGLFGAAGANAVDGSCDGNRDGADGSQGATGAVGENGEDGERGEHGGNGQPIIITISRYSNDTYVLNSRGGDGGNGGRGGDAGRGGDGGPGGNGGRGAVCGSGECG